MLFFFCMRWCNLLLHNLFVTNVYVIVKYSRFPIITLSHITFSAADSHMLLTYWVEALVQYARVFESKHLEKYWVCAMWRQQDTSRDAQRDLMAVFTVLPSGMRTPYSSFHVSQTFLNQTRSLIGSLISREVTSFLDEEMQPS